MLGKAVPGTVADRSVFGDDGDAIPGCQLERNSPSQGNHRGFCVGSKADSRKPRSTNHSGGRPRIPRVLGALVRQAQGVVPLVMGILSGKNR